MKIALYNLEPKIENTALMQVSQYHKEKGNLVEFYSPLFHKNYNKIYAFSIFKYTDKGYITNDMIKGGTGFNISDKLALEIENSNLDYSIYPNCITSYLWFSRGCIRRCPFCVVRKKEGYIKSVKLKNRNPNEKYISIMDNNFFANPKWKSAIKMLILLNKPVDFQSGIDVRLINEQQGEALQKLKLYKYLYIAWDNPKDNLIPKIKLLMKYIKPYRIICYVLIGYWSSEKEDIFRINELRKLKIDPFVMPYNRIEKYQKDFSRWVNHKAIFKSVEWKDYKKIKSKFKGKQEKLK